MIITTPSGFEVSIKDRVSFSDQRAVQRVIMDAMKVKAGTDSQSPEISGAAIMDSQDEAVKRLVIKIVYPETQEVVTETQRIFDTIMEWSAEDAQPVFDAINELTNAAQVPKVLGSN